MTTDNEFIKQMRDFSIDHEPDGYPCVLMKEVTRLCDLAESSLQERERLINIINEGAVPSLDILDEKIKQGFHLEFDGNQYLLFDQGNDLYCKGESIRKLLINLIFIAC